MTQGSENVADCWARFYVQNRRALAIYAQSLTGNAADAADIVQDVLERLVREKREAVDARAYVLRCLRNRAIDLRRTRRPAATHTDGSCANVSTAFLDEGAHGLAARESVAQVRAALGGLSDAQREVIVLKIWAELTFAQVGEVLGQPLGTVTSHYARGIAALRERLQAEMLNVGES